MIEAEHHNSCYAAQGDFQDATNNGGTEAIQAARRYHLAVIPERAPFENFSGITNGKTISKQENHKSDSGTDSDDGATSTSYPASQDRGSLISYFQLLGRYQLLTRQEEVDLARAAKNGCKSSFDRLVASNLRLVVQIAKRFQGRGLELEDLIQEGNFGVIRAAQLFDPNKGIRFSTYATRWIVQKISRAVDNHSRVIRIPVSIHQVIRAINRAKSLYKQKNGVEPQVEELVRMTGLPEHRVELANKYMTQTLSLNQEKYQDEGTEIIEDVFVPGNDIEAYVDQKLDSKLIERLMKGLTALEREVVSYRFGLFGYPELSYDRLAKELAIPKNELRNAFKRALSKLRKCAGSGSGSGSVRH